MLAAKSFAGKKLAQTQTRSTKQIKCRAVAATKKVKKVAKGKAGQKATGKWGAGTDFGSDNSKQYGPSRKLYLPGGILSYNELPSYLNGELAGDYGYDPLSLGTDAATVAKYREFEVLHARWAMLGVAGMIIPEALAANGADIPGASWIDSGKVLLDGLQSGETMNYFAVPWVNLNNPLPLPAVAAIQIGLMGAAENFRTSKEGPKGYAPGVGNFDESVFNGLDTLNPGGPFDPLGLADDPAVFAELKTKEIKNGRLAMMAFLGFVLQAVATREGPYANWSKHIADPFGYNLLTVLTSDDAFVTL